MEPPAKHRRRFSRLMRLKELIVDWALRLTKPTFQGRRQIVSIVGDHISDRIRAQGIYEREVLEILRDCFLDRDSCRRAVAIDVGANIGNHSMFLSDLFARVIAFEPNPLARSLLEINLAVNDIHNVEVKPVGLSDRAARVTLSVDKGNLGSARMSADGRNVQGCVEVELKVGDEAIENSVPLAFIKVDVEGAEEAVLKGLEKRIRAHRPILMMEQLKESIDPASGTSAAFDLMRDLGYSAFEIEAAALFRRRLGSLASLLLGRADYRFTRIRRLEKRDYPALILLPASHSESMPR